MTSIDLETLLTIIFVLIDDWYQAKGSAWMKGKVGRKPAFSDSEVMTLMVAEDYMPYPAEMQYLGFMRANYLPLFPQLLDQSQFNRRTHRLRHLVETMRRDWLMELGAGQAEKYLIDTKPVPVLSYKRSKTH